MKNWPFKVVAGADDTPMVEIKVGGFNKRFSPEEVSGHILAKMKTIVESFLGHEVKNAVITIPANYGDWQRQSTYDAARLAGLNVLRLINEPTAAALAYGFDNLFSGFNRNVLVFDLGGGTLDVSILAVSQRHHFEVKAIAGNVHLGGEDFDTIMVNHVAEEFNRRNRQMDIMSDKKAVRRLTAVCERAKRTLSENTFVAIEIDYLHQGRDYSGKLQRTKFETLCADLFRSTLLPITTALQQANMTKQHIHEIVLAGGSSRIPMIKKLLREYFNNRELRQTVDPEEAIAHGAAIMAAKLSGVNVDARVRNMQLVDITSKSLGIGDYSGNMNFLISKGSSVPCVKRVIRETAIDFTTYAKFCVYEGENPFVVDNNYLGSFTINGLPAKPKGEITFNVTMQLDESGILHVSAVDLFSGRANQITFTRRFGLPQ